MKASMKIVEKITMSSFTFCFAIFSVSGWALAASAALDPGASNVKNWKGIKTPVFAIAAPEDWSVTTVLPDEKLKTTLTTVTMAPSKDVANSRTFVTMTKEDQNFSILKTIIVHADAKLTHPKFQGRAWDMIEYTTVDRTEKKATHWLAVPTKDHHMYGLIAGAPLEDTTQTRPLLEKIMATAVILK
jgi:hypothetical protein